MPRLPVPELPWFEEWMKKTGETFDDPLKLPSIPDLPDLLRMQDGTAIRDPSMWSRRRSELRQLLFHYMIGHRPDERPPLLRADTVCESRSPAGVWRSVRLTFGAPVPVSFEIQLRTPPGGGPFPLFLTQSGHAGWGHIALSRGYGVCLYPGDDSDDASAALTEAYPECDWTLLHRRAYLASLALDYLLQSGEADPDRIAITGHSRNGKQSLIAAACDERIRAVIDASSGTGGSHPFRFSSENYFGESVEMMTRNFPEWFHPRLRLFTGVEDRLPVDCHATVGLIAPRACLISVAHNDPTGTLLGAERVWQAARQAYRLLGREHALSYAPRPGGHEIGASVVHAEIVGWLKGVLR